MHIPEGFQNIRYIFQLDGVPDPMSFGIGAAPELTATPSETAHTAYTAYVTNVASATPFMNTGWQFTGTQVTRTIDGEPVIGEWNEPYVGTGSNPTPPTNSSILIKKLTSSGGRKNRGRIFWPVSQLNEADVSNAGLMGTLLTAQFQEQWTNFLEALETAGLSPFLFHSDPVDTATPIQAFQVQSLLATQRRRMR